MARAHPQSVNPNPLSAAKNFAREFTSLRRRVRTLEMWTPPASALAWYYARAVTFGDIYNDGTNTFYWGFSNEEGQSGGFTTAAIGGGNPINEIFLPSAGLWIANFSLWFHINSFDSTPPDILEDVMHESRLVCPDSSGFAIPVKGSLSGVSFPDPQNVVLNVTIPFFYPPPVASGDQGVYLRTTINGATDDAAWIGVGTDVSHQTNYGSRMTLFQAGVAT